MANKVLLKKSSTASKIPLVTDLDYGELALNYTDGNLYYKNSSNVVKSFGSTAFTSISSNTTAVAGKKYLCDTSGGAFTLTLPASPVAGDTVVIADAAEFATYNLTVGRNSSTIEGSADNLALNLSGIEVTLIYSGTTWNVYAQLGANGGDALTLTGVQTLTNKTLTEPAITTPTITGTTSITYNPGSTTGVALTTTGKDTQGGTGYFDFFKATNTTSGVTDGSKTFRLNNTGGIEIINSAYTANLFTLTNAGNLTVGGTITPGSYTAGQVIKDTMLSNTEVTVVSTTIATSGSNVDFITYDYTPVSSSSYLIVHIHISKYVPAGTVDDSWWSVLKVAGSEIAYGWQKVNDDANGTSGRSGVLFPLTGRYTNSSTTAKTIAVAARRDTADDSITIDNSSTAIWLRITEVAR